MKHFLFYALALVFLSVSNACYAQKVNIGAYYFDGWTGAYSIHITTPLRTAFPERQPLGGFITSTQQSVDNQINLAAGAGLSFFDFCWFYKPELKGKNLPLNNALNLYLNSVNNSKLKFCITVVNSKGFPVGPDDWQYLITQWITLFKNKQYQTANGKPLFVIFDMGFMINQFGSEAAVKQAFDQLRNAAISAGLPGVSIGGAIPADPKNMAQAKKCGFDVLTGYNYYSIGFHNNDKTIPIDSLVVKNSSVWERFKQTSLPYLPLASLNWDPRPWAQNNTFYFNSPRYVGYSAASVYKSVTMLTRWIYANRSKEVPECIGILYAWNEYGEGAWLTPSPNDKLNLLSGVKKALVK